MPARSNTLHHIAHSIPRLQPTAAGTSPYPGHDFSRIQILPPALGAIQPKLAINSPGDEYEVEADRVAQQVMRMPAEQAWQPGEEDAHLETKPIQASDAARAPLPPSVREVIHSPGQPLDSSTRVFVEPRFGHNFGQVRVHADAAAAESARSASALAYTVGTHVVFGEGQYSTNSVAGRQLLAHELTHVIQQSETPALVQGGLISGLPLQASPDPKADPKKRVTEGVTKGATKGVSQPSLHDVIKDLVDKEIKDYGPYKDAISKSKPDQKKAVLSDEALLSALNHTLDPLSFARCVESLGRRAPTYDELKKEQIVLEAIKDAWTASNPGIPHHEPVEPHEEGGWVFMNLIDGSLSIERATPSGKNFIRKNFIKLEPPPNVDNSVVVALFHTHPNLGPGTKAEKSRPDQILDAQSGVPDLIAGTKGTKADVFQISLSGPSVRKHLGSDKKLPGPSGGISP